MTSIFVRGLLVCSLLAPAAAAADKEEKKDPEAERMMIQAHQARAQWGDSFPGFTAKAVVRIDGKQATGDVTVSSDGEVEVNLDDKQAAAWLERTIASVAMHRFASARDSYDVSFADDVTTHPLGRLIRFHGGTTHSLYRVKDDLITEVHRTMDDIKFTISITSVVRNEEGKVLPGHFNVSYWDRESGDLTRNDDFQDAWVRTGNFDLPQRRLEISTSKGKRTVYEYRLSGHRLLEGR